jgi:hypothetical protein
LRYQLFSASDWQPLPAFVCFCRCSCRSDQARRKPCRQPRRRHDRNRSRVAAFFGFELINTSLEPTAEAEVERIHLLDDILREKLTSSRRFEIVDLPPDTVKEIASGPSISNCNGCQRKLTQRLGADWAAWGAVQKVSNLILNINVYMENIASGEMEFGHSVDIRGNTDESWRRGLDYLLRNYLLREPPISEGK